MSRIRRYKDFFILYPAQAKKFDVAILAYEKLGIQNPTVDLGGKKYHIHINPTVSVTNESDVPQFIRKRIKKVGK